MRASLFVLSSALVVMNDGCKPSSEGSVPASTPSAATSTTTTPAAPVVDGEIETKGKVSFEVRSTGGPGTMGPTVLAASSDAALEEVAAYLLAHPAVVRLRVECGVNPTTMSSSPSTKWPAGLALKVARKLVERGIDCKRLEAVGWLDNAPDAPAERVRFFAGAGGPSGRQETRLDVCSVTE